MESPGTPAGRLQELIKNQFEKFKKLPYEIPAAVAIALAALVYFLVATYASTNCFAPLLTPLVLLGLLWYFDTKSVKKLFIIGVVAGFVFAGAGMYARLSMDNHTLGFVATSEDNLALTNGTMEPLRGDAQTIHYYNITVRNASGIPVIENEVRVLIISIGFPNSALENRSLAKVSEERVNESGKIFWVAHYSYSTTTPHPYNYYFFNVKVNDTWILGADYSTGSARLLSGPLFQDSPTVVGALVLPSIFQVFISTFPVYAILVLMIWWTRRARRMREDQIKKYQEEREKEEAEAPAKGKAKTPSLQKAMGLEEETFVCSECGADVPADATVCPKCGEKFD